MRVYLLFTVLLLFALGARSQDPSQPVTLVIPPSPNASALIEYVNIPVNKYTGVPNIQVPFFTLPCQGGVDVPVYHSYHAGGIKVHEIASSAGLGWTLNAGGAITRMMQGKPDEEGYFGEDDGELLDDPREDDIMYHFLIGSNDPTPDIFYFNFLGFQGRFVINHDGSVHTMPYSPLKIEYTSDLESFSITDTKGNKYFFGETSDSREVTQQKTYCDNCSSGGPILVSQHKDKEYTSTWYLSKIVPVNLSSSQAITFSYESSGGDNIVENRYSTTSYFTDGSCEDPSINKRYSDYRAEVTTEDPKYISGITSQFGSVSFQYENDREDLTNGKKLTALSMYNYQNVLIDSFEFEYDYWKAYQDDLNIYADPLVGWLRDAPVMNFGEDVDESYEENFLPDNEYHKRLKLSSIQRIVLEKKKPYRQFTYYDEFYMPGRRAELHDHWGYYNFSFFNQIYIHNLLDLHAFYRNVPYIPTRNIGIKKNPLLITTKINTLHTISYPSGAETVLEYDLNRNSDGQDIGGLRVVSITDRDETSGFEQVISYSYEGGENYEIPLYSYSYDETIQEEDPQAFTFYSPWGSVTFANSGTCVQEVTVYQSESLNSMFDLNGIHIGYSRVTEEFSDGGSIVSEFTNFSDRPDEDPILTSAVLRSQSSAWFILNGFELGVTSTDFNYIEDGIFVVTSNHINKAPFPNSSSFFWERGLPLTKEWKDNQDKTLKKLVFDYDFFEESENERIKALKVTSDYSYSWSSPNNVNYRDIYVHVGEYEYVSRPYRKIQTLEQTFDQDNNSFTQLTEDYQFESLFNMPKSIKKTFFDNTYQKHEYSYPFDVSENNILYKSMESYHMLDYPIETIISTENGIVGSEVTKYGCKGCTLHPQTGVLYGGDFLPASRYELDIDQPIAETSYQPFDGTNLDSRMSQTATLSKYDNVGNLLEFSTADGITTSYIWGYNQSYPVAEVVGATYANIESIRGFGTNFSLGTGGLSTQESNLRSGLPNAMVNTYTYEPQIGMTSMTDEKGYQTLYEYDRSNRLKSIKDNNEDIVERYRYHLSSEDDVLSADYGQCVSANGLVQFEAEEPPFGTNTYIWDFGDGTVIETNDLIITHQYSTGRYTTSLTVMNAEYETVHSSKEINLSATTFNVGIETERLEVSGGELIGDFYIGENLLSNIATYTWSYRTFDGASYSNWTSFGSGENYSGFRDGDLEYFFDSSACLIVKCILTFECGLTSIVEQRVYNDCE